MRRNPGVVRSADGKPTAIAYATGDNSVVAVDLATGAAHLELEESEIIGDGPEGGFLIYRIDESTGGMELVSIGRDLKQRWKRPFFHLAREIAAILGRDRGQVVFNDTSTSIVARDGKTVAVNLVFTDVAWNDGVQGFHAVLSSKDGSVISVAGATCLPGRPALVGGKDTWAWAVFPTTKRNVKTGSVRAVRLAGPGAASGPAGADLKIDGVSKGSIHGYAVGPRGDRLCVVVNGRPTRLLVYPIADGKIAGEPESVRLE